VEANESLKNSRRNVLLLPFASPATQVHMPPAAVAAAEAAGKKPDVFYCLRWVEPVVSWGAHELPMSTSGCYRAYATVVVTLAWALQYSCSAQEQQHSTAQHSGASCAAEEWVSLPSQLGKPAPVGCATVYQFNNARNVCVSHVAQVA